MGECRRRIRAPSKALLSFLHGQLQEQPYVQHQQSTSSAYTSTYEQSPKAGMSAYSASASPRQTSQVDASSSTLQPIRGTIVASKTQSEKVDQVNSVVRWTLSTTDSRLLARSLVDLIRSGQLELARDRLSGFVKAGVEVPLSTFTQVIASLLDMRKYQHVWNIVDLIKQASLEPDLQTYTYMLRTALKENRFVLLHTLETDVKRSKLRMNIQFYNLLLSGHTKRRDLGNISRLVDEMIEQGLKPQVDTVNTLLQAYAGLNGGSEFMENAIRSMQESGLLPDVWTYNTLLSAYIQEREYDKAEYLLAGMSMVEVPPDTTTCNLRIKMLAHQKNLAEMEAIYSAMQIGQLPRPDAVTVSSVMSAFFNHNRHDKAMTVFEEAKEAAITLNAIVFNVMIKHSIKSMTMEEGVQKIISAMQDMQKIDIPPEASTYHIIFRFLGLDSDYGTFAEEYISHMAKVGLTKSSMSELSKLLFQNMPQPRLDALLDTSISKEGSDQEISSKINLLMSRGQVKEAMSIFQDLVRQGTSPSDYVYCTLATGLLANRNMSLATQLLRQAQSSGNNVGLILVTCLAKSRLNGGRFSAWLVQLLEELDNKDIGTSSLLSRFDVVSFTEFAQIFAAQGDWQKTERIFAQMQAKTSLQMDVIAYSVLIKAQLKGWQLDRAVQTLERLSKDPHANGGRAMADVRYLMDKIIHRFRRQGRADEGKRIIKDIKTAWKQRVTTVESLAPRQPMVKLYQNEIQRLVDVAATRT